MFVFLFFLNKTNKSDLFACDGAMMGKNEEIIFLLENNILEASTFFCEAKIPIHHWRWLACMCWLQRLSLTIDHFEWGKIEINNMLSLCKFCSIFWTLLRSAYLQASTHTCTLPFHHPHLFFPLKTMEKQNILNILPPPTCACLSVFSVWAICSILSWTQPSLSLRLLI